MLPHLRHGLAACTPTYYLPCRSAAYRGKQQLIRQTQNALIDLNQSQNCLILIDVSHRAILPDSMISPPSYGTITNVILTP